MRLTLLYTKLKEDRMGTFEDLALSDYTLQDAIYVVDKPTITDRYIGKIEPDEEGKEAARQLYSLRRAPNHRVYFCHDHRVEGGYIIVPWPPRAENGKERDSYQRLRTNRQFPYEFYHLKK